MFRVPFLRVLRLTGVNLLGHDIRRVLTCQRLVDLQAESWPSALHPIHLAALSSNWVVDDVRDVVWNALWVHILKGIDELVFKPSVIRHRQIVFVLVMAVNLVQACDQVGHRLENNRHDVKTSVFESRGFLGRLHDLRSL